MCKLRGSSAETRLFTQGFGPKLLQNRPRRPGPRAGRVAKQPIVMPLEDIADVGVRGQETQDDFDVVSINGFLEGGLLIRRCLEGFGKALGW